MNLALVPTSVRRNGNPSTLNPKPDRTASPGMREIKWELNKIMGVSWAAWDTQGLQVHYQGFP